MIHINSSPEAPPPRIRILDSRAREVETVRIGDRLTFRIEIPEDSKSYIFILSFSFKAYFPQLFSTNSSIWHLCSIMRCYGQGLKEHFPNNRR